MRSIFLLFCLSAAVNLISQNKALDSLWKSYKKPGQADTGRLKTLGVIAFKYSLFNADSGRVLSLQLLKEAKEKGITKAEAVAYNSLGVNNMNLDSNQKAIEAFNNCYALGEKTKDKATMAIALTNLGLVYNKLSDYSKTLDYMTRALKLRLETKDKMGTANAFANLGNVYTALADPTKALEYYVRSLKISEELWDKNLMANNYNNVGNIYLRLRKHDKAIEYFLKSAEIKKVIGNKRGLCVSMSKKNTKLTFAK